MSVLDINSGWPGTEILKDSMTVGYLNDFTTANFSNGSGCNTCSMALSSTTTAPGTAQTIKLTVDIQNN